MNKLLISQATLVNEGQIYAADVLIEGERIARVAPHIEAPADAIVIDARGKHLIPGMIDDQVHFREPGLTHKGTIRSESRAAVAGGTTSFMEMPNVNPQTTTIDALEAKYAIAEHSSVANYSFYLGATNDNLEEIKRLDPKRNCGVKIFMGSSTGNMLVDNQETLAAIFRESPVLLVTHCEDTPTIAANEQAARERWGEQVPMREHAHIRSDEACYRSSSLAVALAKEHGAKLHVLHLTSAKELSLFTPSQDVKELRTKQITAEVCVHHLFFNEEDYETLGSQIKCNPSVKTVADQHALLDAVRSDVLDIIATDHAPHTWEEKQQSYFKAPSGIPLVQHSLLALLELYHNGVFTLEKIVQKTSHAVAERYEIEDRGYIREGYYADLVLLDLGKPYVVNDSNILYHCAWTPFNGYRFHSSIDTTLVNGQIAYQGGQVTDALLGKRLTFDRQ
ncbi:dihydroorotase [Aeromonas diversa CDC 2478-85]|uniref:Dihydroorotase n=1 Tax=Aeromonas diversa CDC 2478-85 TaxID=1268237 RepID=N9TXN4_9GAMM|nr:dihydroorotase [Aeromonas diversa]ENY70879.1 dihydroorotase [Aeromonas diversa CDC 2478-85]